MKICSARIRIGSYKRLIIKSDRSQRKVFYNKKCGRKNSVELLSAEM